MSHQISISDRNHYLLLATATIERFKKMNLINAFKKMLGKLHEHEHFQTKILTFCITEVVRVNPEGPGFSLHSVTLLMFTVLATKLLSELH